MDPVRFSAHLVSSPSAFLAGVGAVKLAASVSPIHLRLAVNDYRLVMDNVGALAGAGAGGAAASQAGSPAAPASAAAAGAGASAGHNHEHEGASAATTVGAASASQEGVAHSAALEADRAREAETVQQAQQAQQQNRNVAPETKDDKPQPLASFGEMNVRMTVGGVSVTLVNDALGNCMCARLGVAFACVM